jgi:signal peptidase I
MAQQQSNSKNKLLEEIKQNSIALIFALIFAILIRSVIVQPFRIPSGSMKPTLMIGDYIFVSKFTYGISKHSLPFSLNIFDGRILKFNEPKRGDIVVFKKGENYYIKRLIGLPGDKVQLKRGTVYINNLPIERHYVGKFEDPDTKVEMAKYIEKLPDNRSYFTLNQDLNEYIENTDEFHVPNKHFFVLGDNRDNSADSRFLNRMGYIQEEYLIGKAQIIFFSTNSKWWEVTKWLTKLDTGRFFKSLEPNKVL